MSQALTRSRALAVWGYLAALTAAEVWAATSGVPRPALVCALGAMALWKALLVALYFMHLKFESRWLLAAAAVPAAVTALTIALLLTDTPLLAP